MSEPARMEPEKPTDSSPVVVKKYANRRLYNTESSSYITLDNLAEMVRKGRDFVVYDAKNGEDITRGVLTQIIVEEENKGRAMLPTGFLRHLIGFYGDSIQNLVPRYLEQAMAAFAQQQQQVRAAMQQTMGTFFPFGTMPSIPTLPGIPPMPGIGNMEEMSRQNMAMMERAMSLFAPFYRPNGDDSPVANVEALPLPAPERELAALRAEVEILRKQLAEAKGKGAPATAKAAAARENGPALLPVSKQDAAPKS